MTEKSRNTLVGGFVLSALVVLCVLMVWFGEAPDWLGSGDWVLRIVGVRELAGISESSPVTMGGVQIGRVQGIGFANLDRPDQGVVIFTRIQQQYSVPRGTMARVYGATLGFGMGHVDLVVTPGLPGPPLDRDYAEIPGEMRSVIGEFISKEMLGTFERTIREIGDLAEQATPVMRNLTQLLEHRSVSDIEAPGALERGLTANLSTVVERLESILAHADQILGDPKVQEEVKHAVHDLHETAMQLKVTVELWTDESRRLSDNLNSAVDRTEQNLDRTFTRLNQGLDHLDAASKSMAGLARQVEEGQGTMGLLARDERLYEAAVITMQRFGELAATMQRIAGKIEEDGYITVGQATPIGTFTKKFPVSTQAEQQD